MKSSASEPGLNVIQVDPNSSLVRLMKSSTFGSGFLVSLIYLMFQHVSIFFII